MKLVVTKQEIITLINEGIQDHFRKTLGKVILVNQVTHSDFELDTEE